MTGLRHIKRIDMILLSLIFTALFWIGESLVHFIFFEGQFVSKNPIAHQHIGYFLELFHPDQHELYMRLTFCLSLVLFGVIMQLIVSRLRFILSHDPITNLPNAVAITPQLRQLLKNKSPHYLALVKLTHLKLIDQNLGSQYANLLVREVGRKATSRYGEFFLGVFRFSTFAFVIPMDAQSLAKNHLKKLMGVLFHDDIELSGIPFHVEAHASLTKINHANNIKTLLRFAYTAIDESLKTSSDITLFKTELDNMRNEDIRFVALFHKGIKSKQFKIYAQPKVDLNTNEITGYELLSRWVHPELGFITPDHYVTKAEDSVAIHALTRYMITNGFNYFISHQLEHSNTQLAFNVSAMDLINKSFFKWLITFVENTNINKNLITFELTESAFMVNPKLAKKHIKLLAKLGLKISIDDFGTGFSAFSYLKDLPIHEIKIDREFITDISTTPRKQIIVKNIIFLAHELNATVCAEGIETEADLTLVKSYGCDVGQGYFWSKPTPLDI
jgi:EAL domain-containing protein (putative c-di-GMP-specific phosphodiesterase class I)/GGDEF domain-containing protein